MRDSVLIVAPEDDAHARTIQRALQRDFDANAIVWDSGRFPSKDRLSFSPSPDGVEVRLTRDDGVALPLNAFRSIWWRRVSRSKISEDVTDEKMRKYCGSECDAFFRGVLSAPGMPVVNSIAAEASAARKPLQLATAARLGLRIPKTLMSNDPADVRAFWEANDRKCIYKPFTAPTWTMAETRVLTPADVEELAKLRHAPIIVQEEVPKGRDVRVSIFGERVFAAEVTTTRPEAELDWRLDLTATWGVHCLPDILGTNLVGLLRALGLHYGCIDLRQRPDGEYVFFEVNPSGQFVFVEIDSGLPVVRAMAELLMSPGVSRMATVSASAPSSDELA